MYHFILYLKCKFKEKVVGFSSFKTQPNLNGWDNVPLRDILEKELRVPVSIENDANAAALGEWEVADINERKVTLRCPISKKKFTWDLFCYFVEERDNSPWPME